MVKGYTKFYSLCALESRENKINFIVARKLQITYSVNIIKLRASLRNGSVET